MISIVEGEDPSPAGADSAGAAVWFMFDGCVRLVEIPGYRKRACSRNRSEPGQEAEWREVSITSQDQCAGK
jgi:hypothetical protein